MRATIVSTIQQDANESNERIVILTFRMRKHGANMDKNKKKNFKTAFGINIYVIVYRSEFVLRDVILVDHASGGRYEVVGFIFWFMIKLECGNAFGANIIMSSI